MTKAITIGVLSPVTGGSYYGEILAGITREVAAVGGRVVLVQTLNAGLSSDEVVGAPDFVTPIAWDRVDGVISIATATQRPYLDRLHAAGKAVVLASDVIEGFAAPSATPDNSTGVIATVDHLVAHGHTAIGFGANLVQPDMRARHEAYRRALRAHSIEPDPKWCFTAFDNGELGGRDVARQFVAAGTPVTALVLATDRNAIGCMAQLADLGVAVPGDVAIVGFDGLEAGTYTQPTLSTVRQPFDEIGASAARLVLAQLGGAAVELGEHPSPSEFVPRGSCGCPDGTASSAELVQFWHDEARKGFERGRRREDSMRQQYEIGIQMLDHERADPRQLEWLAATNVRAAILALWDGDPGCGRLRVAGVFDPGVSLPDLIGTTCTVEQFPAPSLIGLAVSEAGEMTIVVPVKARGLDFGLLAVAGEVDSLSANGRETHNQWAALLTAALEQQALLENVRVSEERYSLWAVATNDGLWDWDLSTGSIYFSGRFMQMLGHEYRGATGGPSLWFDAVHPDDLERLRSELQGAAGGNVDPIRVEHRIRRPDGSYGHVLCRALPVGSPGGSATRIVGSVHDFDRRKQLEDQLRRGALHDEVTGLPNRRSFLERLNFAIAQARRAPAMQYAVVFIDLDGFKLVNDSLGHRAGDRLLSKIGERLRAELREADMAARFGGDEFAVLLHGVEPSAIGPIVERMQARLAAPMELDGHEVAVTATVGIATSTFGYTVAEDVLRDADMAMYHAKSHRPSSYALFDVEMHAGAVSRMRLQSELRHALDRHQFEVHYQPIVDLDNDSTNRFEALVRWRHPERGLVPPLEFLPAMEESGLMLSLGHWIVDEVCRQIAVWQRTFDGLVNVSVNLSSREFCDPGLLPHILECLRRYDLVAANLTIEIIAGVISRNPEVARAVIEELHASGISVQIDDFGTGTSSLYALHRFPLQALKIDRSFIHELGIDPRTTQLVQMIIAMGNVLGLDVVAEGVETAAQLERLRAMGCHSAQGFLFAAAVGGEEAARLLG